MKEEREIPLSVILLNIYAFFYKKSLVITGFFILGAAVAFVLHINRETKYTSHAQICSNIVDNRKIEQKLIPLQEMIDSKDFNSASQLLNISVEQVKVLNSVSINLPEASGEQQLESKKRGHNESCLNIRVVSLDSSNLSWVSDAILNYISKAPYFAKEERLATLRFKSLQKTYQNELDEINKFQHSLYHFINEAETTKSIDISISGLDLDAGQMASRIEDLIEAKEHSKIVYFTGSLDFWYILKENHLYKSISIVFGFTLLGVAVSIIAYLNKVLKSNGRL